VVVCGSPSFFLAGDTSYNQSLPLAGKVDGISPREAISRQTINHIVALAKEQPLVYLPSHDPESAQRLAQQCVLKG
jgi:glyoxylase-like metal-dependent hydrolase (beta-lactamase superfamily II)